MRGLEIAAAVAPLLGLLGTVVGLIDSFSKLGIGSARVDPTMLAGGIWAALLTTAAGLTIAIPALAAHSFFDSILEKLKVNMKDVSVQILALEDEYEQKEVADKSAQITAMVKEAKETLDQAKPSEVKVETKPVRASFGITRPEEPESKKKALVSSEKKAELLSA